MIRDYKLSYYIMDRILFIVLIIAVIVIILCSYKSTKFDVPNSPINLIAIWHSFGNNHF